MEEGQLSLRDVWFKKFGDSWLNDQRLIRLIDVSGKPWFMRLVYSKSFFDWSHNESRCVYEEPGCFVCAKHDKYHTLKKIDETGNIEVYYNVKFVAPCHFLACPQEHRDDPTGEDIFNLTVFSERNNLIVFGNLRDSGASYPRHVHYQPLSDEVPDDDKVTKEFVASNLGNLGSIPEPTILPVKVMPHKEIYKVRDVTLNVVDWPVATYFWEFEGERGRAIASAAASFAPKPYNLMISGRRIYVFGRKTSRSSSLGNFKVATAEVCGCFFCREKEQYAQFTQEAILAGFADTCLVSEEERSIFEMNLIKKTKEVA